ncbi:hypothetical protein [Streptomyces griseus]|uniref:LexA family protein n=1 Tax=Streptomyces griseus TaxID=1911 RepID=UPI002D21CEC7|nr:hypothetical protein [Streptomyces griseus]
MDLHGGDPDTRLRQTPVRRPRTARTGGGPRRRLGRGCGGLLLGLLPLHGRDPRTDPRQANVRAAGLYQSGWLPRTPVAANSLFWPAVVVPGDPFTQGCLHGHGHGHGRGHGPTVREIGERVGLSSTSSVAHQLGRLEARGLISRTGAAYEDGPEEVASCAARVPEPMVWGDRAHRASM